MLCLSVARASDWWILGARWCVSVCLSLAPYNPAVTRLNMRQSPTLKTAVYTVCVVRVPGTRILNDKLKALMVAYHT